MWLPEDSGRRRDAGGAGRGRGALHHPGAQPGLARTAARGGPWDEIQDAHRPQPALSLARAARPSRSPSSSTTAPSRARSPSRMFYRVPRNWWPGSGRHSPPSATGRSSCTAQRTGVLRSSQPFRRDGFGRGLAGTGQGRTVTLTNYGAFLACEPPDPRGQNPPGTSWSCATAWSAGAPDCGCRVRGDWHQRWRGPLRAALDWLRAQADALYEARAARSSRIRGRRATSTWT